MKPVILGTDDGVTTCDCCGKANLKSTVIVDVEGEVMHYGSVCATRHTGKTSKEIRKDISDALQARISAARKEMNTSAEVAATTAKRDAVRVEGVSFGIAFVNACRAETEAENNLRKTIAAKYNLHPYQF